MPEGVRALSGVGATIGRPRLPAFYLASLVKGQGDRHGGGGIVSAVPFIVLDIIKRYICTETINIIPCYIEITKQMWYNHKMNNCIL